MIDGDDDDRATAAAAAQTQAQHVDDAWTPEQPAGSHCALWVELSTRVRHGRQINPPK